MNVKKLCILLVSVFAIACSHNSKLEVSTCGNLEVTGGDIAIIYTNDVHTEVGGYAGVAGFADCVSSAVGAENVSLVDAGDAVQGGAIGTLSDGEYLVDIMNEVGYDVFVPGNHEFDYGMAQMQALMGALDASVISSNFVSLSDHTPVFEAFTTKTYGDIKVAFVGVTTPESFTKSTPAYFQDEFGAYIYGFSEGNNGADLYAAVQAAVDAASQEADYIIAIGHLGVDAQSSPWTSKEVIANTTGIDAFIDGHSHSSVEAETVLNAYGEGVLLTQTGAKLAGVGLLRISPEGEISTALLSDFSEVNADVAAFVDGKMAEFAEDLAEVVATTDVTLLGGNDIARAQETNLGDLVADAYRFVLGDGEGGSADIGFVNGGGIRADIDAGEISFG
jgi:2',3'-cyclic-nucleotide 2'-phosphodiesterase (5'-nucleotidase family)